MDCDKGLYRAVQESVPQERGHSALSMGMNEGGKKYGTLCHCRVPVGTLKIRLRKVMSQKETHRSFPLYHASMWKNSFNDKLLGGRLCLDLTEPLNQRSSQRC